MNGPKPHILVTGAAGFLGSMICPHFLAEGYHVTGVDSLRFENAYALQGFLCHPDFRFVRRDVRDFEGMRPLYDDADLVIPLAAIVGAPACDSLPFDAQEINSDAIRKMVRYLSPLQRILLPQTNSGYGATDGQKESVEEDVLTPISLYGRTKCEAEQAVLGHPNACTLRLATVFGVSPRMRFDLLVNDFTRRAVVDGKIEVFEPHFTRNYVHILDVCRGFAFLAATAYHGAFNFGNPECNLKKGELARVVCQEVGLDPARSVGVAQGGDIDRRNYLVSNKKILNAGFFFKFGLRQGIRKVAALARLLGPADFARMRNI